MYVRSYILTIKNITTKTSTLNISIHRGLKLVSEKGRILYKLNNDIDVIFMTEV